MLAIGRALMTNPQCLLLDEPTEGLAPTIVERVAHAVRGLVAEGVSVLLIEQSLKPVELASDRVYLMSWGKSCTKNRRVRSLPTAKPSIVISALRLTTGPAVRHWIA